MSDETECPGCGGSPEEHAPIDAAEAQKRMEAMQAEQRARERKLLLDDVRLCIEVANETAVAVSDDPAGRKFPVVMPGDLLRHLASLRNGLQTARRDHLLQSVMETVVARLLAGQNGDATGPPFTVPDGIDPA